MPPNDELIIKQQTATTSKSQHNSPTSPTTQIIRTQTNQYLVVIVNTYRGKIILNNPNTG